MTSALSPLAPLPEQFERPAIPASPSVGAQPAPRVEGPMDAVRGILGTLFEANRTVMEVARQFPPAAPLAEQAAALIQQMALVVRLSAETGRTEPTPPSLV